MPNVSRTGKFGTSADCSDLYASKKRNIYLQEQKSKGTPYTQIEKKTFGFDTVLLIKSQNGLDEFIAREEAISVFISGTMRFQGTYNPATIDIEALRAIFAAQFGVSVKQVVITVRAGSVIVEYRLLLTVTQANGVTEKFELLGPNTFAENVLASISTASIVGLSLVPGAPVDIYTNQEYIFGIMVSTFAKISPSQLKYPSGITSLSADNMYVMDNDNTLLSIDTDGNVSTVAIMPGKPGLRARAHVAIDNQGTLYVVAGGVYYEFLPDGTLSFRQPLLLGASGIATNEDGTKVFGANSVYNQVSYIKSDVVDIVGAVGDFSSGFVDANGTSARFNGPTAVAFDGVRNVLYIADTNNHAIRCWNLTTNDVTTIAGSGTFGWIDGIGEDAKFNGPTYLGFKSTFSDYLFVSDTGNNVIRQIYLPTRLVCTLAGSGTVGSFDKAGKYSNFSTPYGLAIMPVNDYMSLHICDAENSKIRKIDVKTYNDMTQQVAVVAGSSTRVSATRDGPGNLAQFKFSIGSDISYDGTGFFYILESIGIRKMLATPPFTVSTIYESSESFNPTNSSISADGTNLYICDHTNNSISVFDTIPPHSISILADINNAVSSPVAICHSDKTVFFISDLGTGVYGLSKTSPHTVTNLYSETFGINISLAGICYDGGGYLYVTDNLRNKILRIAIAPPYNVITIIDSMPSGFVDGISTYGNTTGESRMNGPTGIQYKDGFLYVVDRGNNAIRRINTNAPYAIATISGFSGNPGNLNGFRKDAQFNLPRQLSLVHDQNNSSTTAYLTDDNNSAIRKITFTTGLNFLYTTPGTETYTVLPGYTRMSFVVIGAGGGGANFIWAGNIGDGSQGSGSGGSGAYVVGSTRVAPGQVITITVGAGGLAGPLEGIRKSGGKGNDSLLEWGSSVCKAGGGGGALEYHVPNYYYGGTATITNVETLYMNYEGNIGEGHYASSMQTFPTAINGPILPDWGTPGYGGNALRGSYINPGSDGLIQISLW